jgi:hypothetical protein
MKPNPAEIDKDTKYTSPILDETHLKTCSKRGIFSCRNVNTIPKGGLFPLIKNHEKIANTGENNNFHSFLVMVNLTDKKSPTKGNNPLLL